MSWLTDNRLALLVFALLGFGLVFGPPIDAWIFGPKAAMAPLPPTVANILSVIVGSIATFLTTGRQGQPPANPPQP